METIYHVAASLDGYIADTDHGVHWLEKLNIDQKQTGMEEFFASIDGLIMGRKTFDFVHEYGSWPYGDLPTWVCSNREVPEMDGCNLQAENDLEAAIESAKSRSLKRVWVVGGGQIAARLIELKRLSLVSVSLMPVLLGSGIKLVDNLPGAIFLRQVASRSIGGFSQIEYELDP